MRSPPFNLHSPTTVAEAVQISADLFSQGKDSDWIAGGTDLLPNYKWHLNPKNDVISLSNVADLEVNSANEIGAMVRLSTISQADETHPLIASAAGQVASSLIRNNATLGGNICLDTRCFWFNQGEDWRSSIDWCLKCDCGTSADCRVIPNQNELCVATYQADIAPTLMVLNATIHLAGPEGERQMPISKFFQLDGITRNVLQRGEMVVKVTLPEDADQWHGSYQKLSLRESWDFPEAGVAVAWRKNADGSLAELRVATTALESIPRLHETEVASVMNQGWEGEKSIISLSEAIQMTVKPVNNTAFPPNYRKKMTKVLCQRALRQMNSGEYI
jgi:4-hydroxybenzoyl-CoA reductase subunit beta